jgi:hypothetical protein
LALEGADCDHSTNNKQNGMSCWNLSTAFVLILLIYINTRIGFFGNSGYEAGFLNEIYLNTGDSVFPVITQNLSHYECNGIFGIAAMCINILKIDSQSLEPKPKN